MKLLRAFDELFESIRPHFRSISTFRRARSLAYAHFATMGRRTVTRLICAKNEMHHDWSADYKFFSKRHWNPDDLFYEIFRAADVQASWPDNAILVALDDTNRSKTGKRIPGVSTLRDPMSPPFHVNLRPGLRYLQASVLINPGNLIEFHRAVPVYFQEAAPAKKPRPKASASEKEAYALAKKMKRLSLQGRRAVLQLRVMADRLSGGLRRHLFVAVDGSFCNGTFLSALPETVIPIARARKDLKLFAPAKAPHSGRGRTPIYGKRLPTPEEMRQDESLPWQTARIFGAGRYHETRYKVISPVLWKKGTKSKECRLIIIAPLRYTSGSRVHPRYREAAYLLTTDCQTPVDILLQFYFLRWDIEVNHRDEKSLLGLGDAQMRSPNSVVRNPQFLVILYSLLLLASINAFGPQRSDEYLSLPKWRKHRARRASTLDEIAQMRREILEEQLQFDIVNNQLSKRKLYPKKNN